MQENIEKFANDSILSSNKNIHSFLAGVFCALPFTYPSPPYYFFSFIIYFSMLIYTRKNLDPRKLLLILMAIFIALLSNLFSDLSSRITVTRAIYTSFYFSLFLFGSLVPNKKLFFLGLCVSLNILALLVIYFAIQLKIYDFGLSLFSVPDFRLWGAQLFPDWPNYIAFFLTIGFFINIIFFKKYISALVILIAALLTTSRTPLLAIVLLLVHMLFTGRMSRLKIFFYLCCGIVGFIILNHLNTDFSDRLYLISDREEIYSYAIELFLQSPLIGSGSVLFDKSVGHMGFPSFHNSYLDISVRHGLFGLLIFFILIYPKKIFNSESSRMFISLILLFLVGSFFQNFLKHPHLVMIYSVLISHIFDIYKSSENKNAVT